VVCIAVDNIVDIEASGNFWLASAGLKLRAPPQAARLNFDQFLSDANDPVRNESIKKRKVGIIVRTCSENDALARKLKELGLHVLSANIPDHFDILFSSLDTPSSYLGFDLSSIVLMMAHNCEHAANFHGAPLLSLACLRVGADDVSRSQETILNKMMTSKALVGSVMLIVSDFLSVGVNLEKTADSLTLQTEGSAFVVRNESMYPFNSFCTAGY
jgi:hypothetical protein